MEEERESVRGEEGGKGERGKWGAKGGGCPWLLRCLAEASGHSKSPRRSGEGSAWARLSVKAPV